MKREMRHKDRAIDEATTLEILRRGEYGVLSTVDDEGQPYGVPVNYAVSGNEIYIHCALEGHKLENIETSEKVSFCVIGKTRVLPEKFSTAYESAIVFGRAALLEDSEKQAALEAIREKYSPEQLESGAKYIKALFDRVCVIRVSIEQLTGKASRA